MPFKIKCTLPIPTGTWMVPATKNAAAKSAVSGKRSDSKRRNPTAMPATASTAPANRIGVCNTPSDKCIKYVLV